MSKEIVLDTFVSSDTMSKAVVVLINDQFYVKKYVCKELLKTEGPLNNINRATDIANNFTANHYIENRNFDDKF